MRLEKNIRVSANIFCHNLTIWANNSGLVSQQFIDFAPKLKYNFVISKYATFFEQFCKANIKIFKKLVKAQTI